ncbi:3-phosphoglycerate dehydrogenase [Corallincola luteus]|uniref:D-3-phosphoglycerate dehydrogenase n=1 Tax=Corallincola luteus TaxID=1775177 RepID=A0ABY2AQ64_9GAMM|nr:3-phosphoglycerate dehydrogenase family protein [Corallincola luteus]TCI03676.1 3-phosphoglycerate dehydrogenase [Corallincola luteus]
MRKIRTYNQIASRGLDRFSRDSYEVGSEIAQPEAILLRSHKLTVDQIPDSVNAIARAGAGVNNIPIDECTHNGVVVFNTPGANANAVKELVLAGLLLSSRGICEGMQYVQALTETDPAILNKEVEKGKKAYAGVELTGKTLGVVGLGAIGANVANMALELGMEVIGYDPAISVEAAWRLSSDVQRAENLGALLAKCDYVTLHVPAIEATKGMINSEALSSAKQGLKLLNFARGEIVDNDAMLAALEVGKVARYISDFPSLELLGNDKVSLLPHLGASTVEAEENCAIMGANQLVDFLENGNIKNSVNFPQIRMERTHGYRLTFANDNVPKVLSQVLALLADMNINVIDLLNKSRNDIAYTILDIEQQPDAQLLAAVAGVEHVFHVRAV